jgi:hypothetical protein
MADSFPPNGYRTEKRVIFPHTEKKPLSNPLFYKEITEGYLVGATRFERATTRTPSECATRLRHAPIIRSGLKCL